MKLFLLIRRRSRALLSVGAVAALCCGALLGAAGTSQAAASTLPCDIYAAAGTPCVSADSTVRALYQAYDGPLYQVRRSSDGHTADIGPLAPAATRIPPRRTRSARRRSARSPAFTTSRPATTT